MLRVVIKTDGEVVTALQPHVGNLHRCAEKIGESLPYYQFVPYVDRMDYLAAINNEHGALHRASSGCGGIVVPERAEYIRIILAEVQRIVSHVMAVGVYGLDIGAITPFLHTFRERERGLDLLDHISGGRLLYHVIRIGGVKRDLTPEWIDECRAFLDEVERRLPEYNALLMDNHIFRERTVRHRRDPARRRDRVGRDRPGAARLGRRLGRAPRRALRHLRPLRVRRPGRRRAGSRACVGDCFHRHWVRVQEIEQSIRIVRQALRELPPGEIQAKVPPRASSRRRARSTCASRTRAASSPYYLVTRGRRQALARALPRARRSATSPSSPRSPRARSSPTSWR